MKTKKSQVISYLILTIFLIKGIKSNLCEEKKDSTAIEAEFQLMFKTKNTKKWDRKLIT